MTIRKFCKGLAVILTGVLMMAFLGGCGSSEKFAGHWIGYGKDGYPKETDCIYDVTIEKNGKGYIVNMDESRWKLEQAPGSTWKDVMNNTNEQYVWTTKKNDNLAASAKENTLSTTTESPIRLTYMEKDDTLQLVYSDSLHMQPIKVTLHKAKDGETDEFKNKSKDDLTKAMDPSNPRQFKD